MTFEDLHLQSHGFSRTRTIFQHLQVLVNKGKIEKNSIAYKDFRGGIRASLLGGASLIVTVRQTSEMG